MFRTTSPSCSAAGPGKPLERLPQRNCGNRNQTQHGLLLAKALFTQDQDAQARQKLFIGDFGGRQIVQPHFPRDRHGGSVPDLAVLGLQGHASFQGIGPYLVEMLGLSSRQDFGLMEVPRLEREANEVSFLDAAISFRHPALILPVAVYLFQMQGTHVHFLDHATNRATNSIWLKLRKTLDLNISSC